MMLHFYKYHGAGNDFIILNMLDNEIKLNSEQIRLLCDRHLGIGADGLMMLLPSEEKDFIMKYYNSDGFEGSMCGNGGRCIISFAYDMGIKKPGYSFMAVDGMHSGRILSVSENEKTVELQMSDVSKVQMLGEDMLMDTGSPHYLQFVEEVESLDVFEKGKAIRYSDAFKKQGVNVNFVKENADELFVRTYERGVEAETLACGTGVTAAAIAAGIRQQFQFTSFNIHTLGGELKLRYQTKNGKDFTNIFLTGPAKKVFEGEINI